MSQINHCFSPDVYERVLADTKGPADYLEPVLDTRGAAMRYIDVLNGFANRIESGLIEGNLRSVQVAFFTAAYALGLKCCTGMNITERARQLGVDDTTIYQGAKEFVECHGLSPSCFMCNGNGVSNDAIL